MALHDPIELDAVEAEAFKRIRAPNSDPARLKSVHRIDEYVKRPPFKTDGK